MAQPLEALFAGIMTLSIFALLLWPRTGLMARWRKLTGRSRRIRIEDTLKHLYDCEYRNLVCTRQSISGVLSISADDTAGLLAQLERHHLLRADGEGFVLTEEGRSYALRIIRVHRLWERYLADETGVDEIDWHQEAEQQEHRISPSEADALAAQMGNPNFDPHGDPIPTSSGEIPDPQGEPLNSLRRGDIAGITHVEDEPKVIYAQITAVGLIPGMSIRILDVTNESIRFEADGNECVLAPIVAANVTVRRLKETRGLEGPFESLDSLKPGEKGTVIGISKACRGLQRRRLMDLGVVPGTIIENEMQSASGDPTAYRIRGASIALRKKQAAMIQINREKETEL